MHQSQDCHEPEPELQQGSAEDATVVVCKFFYLKPCKQSPDVTTVSSGPEVMFPPWAEAATILSSTMPAAEQQQHCAQEVRTTEEYSVVLQPAADACLHHWHLRLSLRTCPAIHMQQFSRQCPPIEMQQASLQDFRQA